MTTKRWAELLPLAGLFLLASCGSKKQQTETAPEAVKVEVMTAALHEVDRTGTFTATVEAEMTNQIAPQNAGRIRKIQVEVGDHVSAGQALARMDAVNLEQTRLQLENKKLEFERTDELYKVGGVSKSTWDSYKLAYELAQSSYDNLQENTTLVSPISGIVTARNYDSGDMFTMGDPIFTVERIRPVKLMVHVSESLYTEVKKGTPVDVVFNVYGDEVFKGSVKLVYPSIDPGTRTFPVEVQIQNSDERVRPGMFGRVTFNFGTQERVLIADRAVQKQVGSAEHYVYIYENEKASLRTVTAGRRLGDQYEILDGIQPGETVIVTGQNRLNDGASVEVIRK